MMALLRGLQDDAEGMLPQFDECNAGYRALQGKTSPPTGRVSALDG
jgi:hypothetical protein